MKNILCLLAFTLSLCTARGQGNLRYWKEVQAMKQLDSAAFPGKNQILLIGSSSFTNWRDVQVYFPRHRILNRAFGGSILLDQILYRYDVLYPYDPKQVVLYCGENDFDMSDTVTPQMVLQRFKTWYALFRQKYPVVPFLYVAMKPSPSRWHLYPKFQQANLLIQQFLGGNKRNRYVDMAEVMITAGRPDPSIFLSDSLHMNAVGYQRWQKKLAPLLRK